MTPWEVETHLASLLGEIRQHPQAGAVRATCGRFRHEWRALWAQHGASEEATSAYGACLSRFLTEVQGPASQIRLPNDILLHTAIIMRIGKAAIADPATEMRLATPAEMA